MLALVAGMLVLAATVDAALTTGACLAQKQTAWGVLRKCQATERSKILKGKRADLAKCQTKFQDKLAKISAKGTKATISCRYGGNGDGTVTDYDTGLQWETKNGEVGGVCLIFVDRVSHCVNGIFDWVEAQSYVDSLNGSTTDGLTLTDPFAGFADWRLPTIVELRSVLDLTAPGCGNGAPCIHPVFGATLPGSYWSSTTLHDVPALAIRVSFLDGELDAFDKALGLAARAVRGHL